MLAFRSLARVQSKLSSAPCDRQPAAHASTKRERVTMKQWTRKGVARGLLVTAALLFVVAGWALATTNNNAAVTNNPRATPFLVHCFIVTLSLFVDACAAGWRSHGADDSLDCTLAKLRNASIGARQVSRISHRLRVVRLSCFGSLLYDPAASSG